MPERDPYGPVRDAADRALAAARLNIEAGRVLDEALSRLLAAIRAAAPAAPPTIPVATPEPAARESRR